MLAGVLGVLFTIYTNIESVCCTQETNMLYINYISKKLKKVFMKILGVTIRGKSPGYIVDFTH